MQQQQGQSEGMENATQMSPQQQFGGLEVLEANETIGALVGGIEHFAIFKEHIQDQQFLSITEKQHQYLSQLYNTIIDTFKSGKDPAMKTQTYEMGQTVTSTVYGMQPSSPKTPIQSMSELNDECISSALLGQLKGIATHFTTTSLESTNPVLRRIFADSVPNIIEMAYEIYLYQNKNQYYQVPQLSHTDTQTIQNSYAPIQSNMAH